MPTHISRLFLATQTCLTHSQLQALLPGPTSIQVRTGPQLRLLSTSPDRVSRYCSSSGTSICGQVVRVGSCEETPREPTALLYCPRSPLGRTEIQPEYMDSAAVKYKILSYQFVNRLCQTPMCPHWSGHDDLPMETPKLPMILKLKGASRTLLQF